ncbi:unnamed protein product [Cladocopium goreaui]|uniref:Uncharacterized protein n=1 Tax=Cladocopium goreaui TaxID=2562237 RepID=A0A9P1FPB9_9DINO|nr:unnamed protein product [Cladocopium goreaui]
MLALIFHLGSLECHDPSRYVKHTFLSYRTHQRDLRDEDYDRALLGFIFLPPWEQQDGAARRKIKVEHFFAIPGRCTRSCSKWRLYHVQRKSVKEMESMSESLQEDWGLWILRGLCGFQFLRS